MTKKKYNTPKIEEIRLDNQISLQLTSNPTIDPGKNLAPRSRSARSDDMPSEDPYQYDNW